MEVVQGNNNSTFKEKTNDRPFDADIDAAWYVIGCMSGRDNNVYETLTAKMNNGKWTEIFLDVVLPMGKELHYRDLKSGVRKVTEKYVSLINGYVFVHCVMTNDLWFELRNTPGVIGIIGSHGKGAKPTPLPEDEVTHVLQLAGRIVDDQAIPTFKKDDEVMMSDGPFKGQIGRVCQIDESKQLARVEIMLFGKETEIELSIFALKKN